MSRVPQTGRGSLSPRQRSHPTSRSESGGGDGLLFLLPRPRDFPSEARRNRSESESLMGVDGLWMVLYSPEGKEEGEQEKKMSYCFL